MKPGKTLFQRSKKWNRKRGASATTYGLIVGLIAIVALVSVQTIGSSQEVLFEDVACNLAKAVNGEEGNCSLGGGSSDGAPVVSTVPTQFPLPGTSTGALPFSVSDSDTPIDLVGVVASSDNQALVPDGNITLLDDGAGNFTVDVQLASGEEGQARITLTASDGALTGLSSFTVSTTRQVTKIYASDPEPNGAFGADVLFAGSTMVVGAPQSTAGGLPSAGKVYLFSSGDFTEQAQLTAASPSSSALFGISLAHDGGILAVGAPLAGAGLTGQVHVFSGSGSSWSEIGVLQASDGQIGGLFGLSVAVRGNTVAVGWPGRNGSRGAVYVFDVSGQPPGFTLNESHRIELASPQANDLFGSDVGFSGSTIIATAPALLTGRAGKVVPLTFNGSAYVEGPAIQPTDSAAGDEFGVSVTPTTGALILGAGKGDSGALQSGASYRFTGGGASWTQSDKFSYSTPVTGDLFGLNAQVSGGTTVIAAPGDDEVAAEAGAVFVFSGGSEVAKLTADDGYTGQGFGNVAAIAGEDIAIGTPNDVDQGSGAGAVYIFDLSNL